MLQVYGIRHHGPGSARNLLEALEAQGPDIILVEGPSDADAALEFIGTDALSPPVALFVFDPKDYRQGSYYPFAKFSPEWQALVYAHKYNTPAAFIDLPVSIFREWTEQASRRLAIPAPEDLPLGSRDPLGEFARLDGYEDGEAWWDLRFERKPGKEVFEQIAELMRSLRTDLPGSPLDINTIREAWMRERIRKNLKKYQNIAVVCGAMHVPALEAATRIPAATDKKILKGLKVKKMAITWIPWSYDRLAYQSGYKAGVLSPAWYEILFASAENAATHWMVRAARLLREADLDASSAQVIDAVRLAKTLTVLRNHEIPGIHELQEAAISVLGQGDSEKLDWLRHRIVIGDKIGKISSKIPRIPLQEDIEKTLKKTRLNKDWNTTEVVEKKLDLRKGTQQEASILLYRLQLIGIPWGVLVESSPYNTGSFSESWQLERLPEFDLLIIEAAVWGNTLPEACIEKIRHRLRKKESLKELSYLLRHSLKADLSELTAQLLQSLRDIAAQSQDILDMMQSVPELVTILRYGQTRKTDRDSVKAILEYIFPRFCIGLPTLVQQIDAELAEDIRRQLLQIQRSLHILPEEHLIRRWFESLDSIAGLTTAHPKLRGLSTRLRFERHHISVDQFALELHYAMSEAQPTDQTAYWLEGFLSGNNMQLLYQPLLWEMLDRWISELSEQSFSLALPVLRRSFADSSVAERKKIFDAARFGLPNYAVESSETPKDTEREALIVDAIKDLMGWKPSDKIG